MLSSWRCGSSTVRVMKLRINAPYGADLGGLLENVALNSPSTPLRLEAVPLRCRAFRRSLKFELRELRAKFLGARCFLILSWHGRARRFTVLMQLMARGAF